MRRFRKSGSDSVADFKIGDAPGCIPNDGRTCLATLVEKLDALHGRFPNENDDNQRDHRLR